MHAFSTLKYNNLFRTQCSLDLIPRPLSITVTFTTQRTYCKYLTYPHRHGRCYNLQLPNNRWYVCVCVWIFCFCGGVGGSLADDGQTLMHDATTLLSIRIPPWPYRRKERSYAATFATKSLPSSVFLEWGKKWCIPPIETPHNERENHQPWPNFKIHPQEALSVETIHNRETYKPTSACISTKVDYNY